ncbi:hypothetical protein [Candidatus Rariloculus sp.]
MLRDFASQRRMTLTDAASYVPCYDMAVRTEAKRGRGPA